MIFSPNIFCLLWFKYRSPRPSSHKHLLSLELQNKRDYFVYALLGRKIFELSVNLEG